MLRAIYLFTTCFLAAAELCLAAPIDSIRTIRALSPEEADKAHPAVIEAVVTYRDPTTAALLAYDGEEGIYVELPKTTVASVATGTRVRIEGVTQSGGFLPIVQGRRIEVLGVEPLPEPRRIDSGELFSPSLDCQWVEVPAIITGVEEAPGVVLIAEISGWTVKLLLPKDTEGRRKATRYMQRPVLVRGVVGSVFNGQRQLTGRHFFVPSFEHLIPSEIDLAEGRPRIRAIDELLRSDSGARTPVRIQGVITHVVSDGIYLRGEGGSIFVRGAIEDGVAPGSRIECEGFASVAPFRPIFRATWFSRGAREELPQPAMLDLSGRQLPRQQAELVTVEADFLGMKEAADGGAVLQCRAGRWFFEAHLVDRLRLPAALRENDRLKLTGICELTTTRVLPYGNSADGFRILLRSGDDIAVLRRAPWWTLERLLWVLGVVGSIAFIAFAWVVLLRRRVVEQTQIIGAQIQRAAVTDERQRIARELHDTIEQELAGLSAQLRNARQRLAHAPEQVGSSLELAEKMLRHCRAEARTSIRDLRSVALEQRGLRGALQEFLEPLASESGARFVLLVAGEPRGLPGPTEIHLLRIAHEAVANASRHAKATEIRVRLGYEVNQVVLEIRDDGCGFDPAAPAPRGHFGVLGLHERANKLQATLVVQSAPGAGTTIRVVAPTTSTARENGQHL